MTKKSQSKKISYFSCYFTPKNGCFTQLQNLLASEEKTASEKKSPSLGKSLNLNEP